MASESENEDSPLLLYPHHRSGDKAEVIKNEDLDDPHDEEELLTNFDQVLAVIGDYGLWQQLLVALLWLPSIGGGIIVLLWSFTGLEPSAFRCALPCDGPEAKFADIDVEGIYFTSDKPDFCSAPVIVANETGSIASNCSGW